MILESMIAFTCAKSHTFSIGDMFDASFSIDGYHLNLVISDNICLVWSENEGDYEYRISSSFYTKDDWTKRHG